MDDDRHSPPVEVERDLVTLEIPVGELLRFDQVLMLQDRLVEQVLQSGLEMAVEEGVFEDPFVLLAGDVQVHQKRHLVLGQRPGLVGAEDVHRAEVLDRAQLLDDDLAAGHRHGPAGEGGRDDHRQHLGSQPDRDGDGEEEGRDPAPLGQPVDDEDQRDHHQREADQQPANAVDAPIETGLGPFAHEVPGQSSQISTRARGDDDRLGGAADHVGSHEAGVGQFERTLGCRTPAPIGGLLDGQRLAGQDRLADEQVLGRDEDQVGRDHVAGGQVDDVAGNEELDRYLFARRRVPRRVAVVRLLTERQGAGDPRSRPAHCGGRPDHRPQPLGRQG